MAIAYGICDNVERRNVILDHIENQMQKEKLFFWPLNLYTYKEGEGNDWQFPFPAYENGDIFLSWGAVAVKAYADYKPELALKYVRNVMQQHSIDGLAFQRYGRAKQDGLGDDILSGNSLSVVGLYQAIYGINPMYNRFYLNPHITQELAGTELNYRFRGQLLKIGLDMNRYAVANDQFKIIDTKDFGFYSKKNELCYFSGSNASASLEVKAAPGSRISIEIKNWRVQERSWVQTSTDRTAKPVVYTVNDLTPGTAYMISAGGKKLPTIKANAKGRLSFTHQTGKATIISISKA
jgi:hypothetical protein